MSIRAEAEASAERADAAESSLKKLQHEMLVKDQEVASLSHKLSLAEDGLDKAEESVRTQDARYVFVLFAITSIPSLLFRDFNIGPRFNYLPRNSHEMFCVVDYVSLSSRPKTRSERSSIWRMRMRSLVCN